MGERNGKVHLVLDDEMLIEIWVGSARQMARIDSDLDIADARRNLGIAADLVEQLVARVHELESDLFHAGPGTIVVDEERPSRPPTTQELGVPREPKR